MRRRGMGQVTATLVDTTNPGKFYVGDSWTLTIVGPPNSPVSNTASQNGVSLGTTGYGSTDADGKFSLTGTFPASTIGAWVEQWMVGGAFDPQPAPISFTVSAVPAQTYGGSTPPATTSVPTSNSSTSPAATCFQPLAQWLPDPCVGPIGVATLAAGIVGLMIVGSLLGGKR